MTAKRAGEISARIIGAIITTTCLYNLGGFWLALLPWGIFAWLPSRWFE